MRKMTVALVYNRGTLRKPEVPGRNEPCPCGSGKKYKRCHGAEISARETEMMQTAHRKAEESQRAVEAKYALRQKR